jgi:hypothetical protein
MGTKFGSKLNSPHVMDDAHLQSLKKTKAMDTIIILYAYECGDISRYIVVG